MQENEFEKRLREEMGEFRLRPSEVVWDKIEDELKKKKRRRVVFYIFMLAGLSLLGYSGYYLLTPGKQILSEQKPANANELIHKDQKPGQNDVESQNAIPGVENIKPQNETKNTEQIISPARITPTAGSGEQIGVKKQRANKRTVEMQMTDKPTLADKNITAAGETTILQSDKDSKPVMAPDVIPAPPLAIENNKVDKELPSENKQVNAGKPDSATATNEKQEQKLAVEGQQLKKKIRWGLDLSVGMSQINNKALSFSGVSQRADALYSNVPNAGVSSTRGGSETLRGIAFKVGIVGELSITKKSSVTAGLGYAYYSNEIKTGAHKDSSFVLNTMTAQAINLDSYYQGSQVNNQGSQVIDYTNHYHFVQLPIGYQLQLNKGVKVPILWSIGLTPAYLFSTNALTYDTASGGIYYKNKDAFNRFHFNLNTGLAFRFGKANKLQWSLGPELSMDMTPLAKDAGQNRYFMYGGITGRLFFKKKNAK